jgi:hypothetical protein
MSGSPRRPAGDSSDAAKERRGTTSSSGPSDASVADMLNELLRRSYLSARRTARRDRRPGAPHRGARRRAVPDRLGAADTRVPQPSSACGSRVPLRRGDHRGPGLQHRVDPPILLGNDHRPDGHALRAVRTPDRDADRDQSSVRGHLQGHEAPTADDYRLRAALAASPAAGVRHRSPRARRDAGALLRQRGDALDYVVNDGVLHVGVFDAIGHGLAAAGVAAFASRPTGTAAVAAAGSWKPTL